MRLYKTIDQKFERIGFKKVKENEYVVEYERFDNKFKFTQKLDLIHKQNGRHIIQSVDKDLVDNRSIGNTCVGLTMYEAILCVKKMKQMGWKIKK